MANPSNSPAGDAVEQQGVPHKGTEALDTAEHHVEPNVFGLDATIWVSLAMFVFLAILVWKKVPALIAGSLDKRIAAIRAQLDEAAQLRKDAEALKGEYEAKLAGLAGEAAAMRERSEHEAEALVAKAKADASDLIARRKRMAEDRIGAAERQAVAEVRAKAVDVATAASAALIAEKVDGGADKQLVDEAISGI